MKVLIIRVVYRCLIGCILIQTAPAQWQLTDEQKREIAARPKPTLEQIHEQREMLHEFNHDTLAYRAAMTEKMLVEANYFSDRLKLPTPHPISIADIEYAYTRISQPWFSILHKHYPPSYGEFPDTIFTTNIGNASIPREARLRALEIGVTGVLFEKTNFDFYFREGRLWQVMRVSAPEVERYALHLNELVGKPSLIDTNEAYQLATQWLAAMDVDVAALEKQFPPSVNQLQYSPLGATNAVLLPLYYVDFGLRPHQRDSPVEVEILGTTKELQDITINDSSFSRRPLLLITNALDLVRTPNPLVKELHTPPKAHTNSVSH